MRIQKVQSNQTSFGTKVKMNPDFIEWAGTLEEYKRLKNQIKILENNGIDDILSICDVSRMGPQIEGMSSPYKLFAKVYQIKGNRLIQGTYIESSNTEYGPRGGCHFKSIIDLYNEAKKDLKIMDTAYLFQNGLII